VVLRVSAVDWIAPLNYIDTALCEPPHPRSMRTRMTEKQIKEFEALAKPLVEWINANKNPHTKIVIDCMGAEVVDGCYGFHTDEYVKD